MRAATNLHIQHQNQNNALRKVLPDNLTVWAFYLIGSQIFEKNRTPLKRPSARKSRDRPLEKLWWWQVGGGGCEVQKMYIPGIPEATEN